MKTNTANSIRSTLIADLLQVFTDRGEDCGMVTSGSFNFPVVVDGEEGWIEIVVKVPKYADEEGYELRNDYSMKLEERAEKAKAMAKAKADKIARDKAERERKKAEREAKKAEKTGE